MIAKWTFITFIITIIVIMVIHMVNLDAGFETGTCDLQAQVCSDR